MIPPGSNPLTVFFSLGFISPPPAKPEVFSILVVSRDEDAITLRHECLATIAWGGPLPHGWGRELDVWDWLVHGGSCTGHWFEHGDVSIYFVSREDDDPIYAFGIEIGDCESWIATRQTDVALSMAIRLLVAVASDELVERQPINAYHANPSEN